MGRRKLFEEPQLLAWLDEYWAYVLIEREAPFRHTYKGFAEYLLTVKKVSGISDNLLRHTPAVKARFEELKAGEGTAVTASPPLMAETDEDRAEKARRLENLLYKYLVPELCNHVLRKHEKLSAPDNDLVPELADQGVVTPKTRPFEHEIVRNLAEYFEDE